VDPQNLLPKTLPGSNQAPTTPEACGLAQGTKTSPSLSEPLPRESIVAHRHISVANSACYQAVRQAISHNEFRQADDSPWPTAVLDKGAARGKAQLMPLELQENPFLALEKRTEWIRRMEEERAKLTDLDADVLDLLTAIWLVQARRPSDPAVADVDQLLSIRALQPKRGQGGRQSGYRPEQRAALCHSIARIESLWITLSRQEIYCAGQNGKRTRKHVVARQSRAFVMTARLGQVRRDGHIDPFRFCYRPGDILSQFLFGPGRQVALLSAKAVEYDPYRQTWEKRLARYLSWQWRIQATTANYLRPFKAITLLEAVGAAPDLKRPNRMRDRLEKALETLQEDRVIQAWQYECWDESITEKRGWAPLWLNTNLLVEPPDLIKDAYHSIRRPEKPSQQSSPPTGGSGLQNRVRQVRTQQGVSQLVAAQQIGISHNLLCMIEKGRRKPSRWAQRKIEGWLAGN
jgi:hypothetical protein